MAPRKQFPASLEDACLTQILIFLKNIARNHSQSVEIQEEKLTEDLRMVMEFVPPPIHDKVANLHLHGVKKVFGEDDFREDSYAKDGAHVGRRFYQGEVYFNCLMSIMGHLKVKTMHMNDWPKYMQVKLVDFLDKMTWLQDFSCGYLNVDDEILSNACLQFTNLSSFSLTDECTDEMLSVLCVNCKMLRIVKVPSSLLVSDDCIESLVNCENLLEVDLSGTRVSSDGYFRLLNDSESSLLSIGGLEIKLKEVLDKMELFKPLRRFKLEKLQCRNLDEKYLCLTIKYFPFLTKLSFVFFPFIDCHVMSRSGKYVPDPHSNFSVLSQLKHLKTVMVLFWLSPSNIVRMVLSSSPHINRLQFSECTKSKTGKLLSVTSKFCPQIETLIIRQDEVNSESGNILQRPIWTNSFKKLTVLVWDCPSLLYVLDVLVHATNLQKIKLEGESDPALSDQIFASAFTSVLTYLKHLRELEILCPNNTVSSKSMKRTIVYCERLTSFKIHSPTLHKNPSELRDFVTKNNYDVDFVACVEDD